MIPTVYLRDPDGFVINTPNAEAQWVFDGEGTAWQMFGGMLCRKVKDDVWDIRDGYWQPLGEWYDKWKIAWSNRLSRGPDGVYYFMGEGIAPGEFTTPTLLHQLSHKVEGDPYTLACFGARRDWKGILWKHPDGRMAKLKISDFKKL